MWQTAAAVDRWSLVSWNETLQQGRGLTRV
jgi:hypothetical protein